MMATELAGQSARNASWRCGSFPTQRSCAAIERLCDHCKTAGHRPSAAMSAQGEKRAVKLISAEGFEFVVDYDAACVSNTIKNMLSSQGARRGGGGCFPAALWAACAPGRPVCCSYAAEMAGKCPDCLLAVLPFAAAAAAAAWLTPPRVLPAAGNFIENEQGEIRFPEISTPVLEVVCKYFYYKVGWWAGRLWYGINESEAGTAPASSVPSVL